MSDNEKDFSICKYCEVERGLCDRIFLDDDRRFSIKLDENFEVDTVSHNDKSFFVIKHDICFICFNLYFFTILLVYPLPCKSFVLDKIGFSPLRTTMEVKRVYLKTEHGCIFHAKLHNADTYTYFKCKTWQALCKTYAFEPDMFMTFDIRPEDDIEGNRDIWVDV